jgi:hypothetical protein
MVASGLMMKSDRQLNHTLYMLPEIPRRRPVAGPISIQGAPDVFERFMSVEKVGSVEQIEASVEVPAVGQDSHSGWAFTDCGTQDDNLHVSVESLVTLRDGAARTVRWASIESKACIALDLTAGKPDGADLNPGEYQKS